MYFRKEFESNSDSSFCNGRKRKGSMKQRETSSDDFFQEATASLFNKQLSEVTEC